MSVAGVEGGEKVPLERTQVLTKEQNDSELGRLWAS